MSNSVHNKLERVRKPRTHIKYEVETEGGVVQKELPFVVGVLGDFSGNPTEALKSVKDRKFTTIDRDNFNEVMARQNAGLKLRVENTLEKNGTEMAVELKFSSMEDFDPAQIVDQVPALRELKAVRDKLKNLSSKADRSAELEAILENTLKDPEKLKQLAKELKLDL